MCHYLYRQVGGFIAWGHKYFVNTGRCGCDNGREIALGNSGEEFSKHGSINVSTIECDMLQHPYPSYMSRYNIF